MIKANELRIGNKVDYYGNIVTINYINDTDVGFSDYVPFDYPLFDDINPIPITEEWLLRVGFKNDDDGYNLGLDNVLVIEFIEDYAQLATIEGGFSTGIDIHYIHQLQNLYYALTGEELKYDN